MPQSCSLHTIRKDITYCYSVFKKDFQSSALSIKCAWLASVILTTIGTALLMATSMITASYSLSAACYYGLSFGSLGLIIIGIGSLSLIIPKIAKKVRFLTDQQKMISSTCCVILLSLGAILTLSHACTTHVLSPSKNNILLIGLPLIFLGAWGFSHLYWIPRRQFHEPINFTAHVINSLHLANSIHPAIAPAA